MRHSHLALCFGLVSAWAAGCGSSAGVNGPPPTAQVKGTINMDGKPVLDAEIQFGMPGVPPSLLAVKDGRFSGDAPVGKNKVEVFIYVEGKASAKYAGTAEKRNVAPGRYWGPNTKLEANVSAGGPNEFKFDMTTK